MTYTTICESFIYQLHYIIHMIDKKELKKFFKHCLVFHKNVKKKPLEYVDDAKDILKKINLFKKDKDILKDEKLLNQFYSMEKAITLYLSNVHELENINFGVKK